MCEFRMMNCEMIRPLFTGAACCHCYIPTSIHALSIVLISFVHLSSQSNEQGIPRFFKRQLHIGQDFKYTCCAKRNATIWFRWGIHLPGSDHDPVPHYSRATVKETNHFDIKWTKDFNASRYKNRGEVTYDPKTLCMVWKILRVRKGDDNTFFGVYRDDPSLGKQFQPCNTKEKLVVVKRMPTFSTPSPPTPSNLELDTPPTSEGSHVTKEHTTEDDTENTTVPLDVSIDEPKQYLTLAVIAMVVLFVLIVGSVIYCKRNQIHQWFNSIRSQDRTINAQDLARKSAKKLRRRISPRE